ncbi:MAG: hypothetical protein KGD61_06685 [Candidatus Lokiarchaeota archaeon]|nr:hypothetical protein [Candidatus Lokiarchaeota archaeon]
MVKHTKTGAYEHFCVLIFAQGTWKETDRDSVRNLIKEKMKSMKEASYNIFFKLTYRDQIPIYADCHLCQPIYKMFEEFKGNSDGILYQGHHYLIPEDDFDDMKSLANLIISHSKVKKFYLLYLDGFKEIKRTGLDKMNLEQFKEKLKFNKCTIHDFILIIDNNRFRNRTVYEISKSRGAYN